MTERIVSLPPGTDARPGAWSPSGRYLLAYSVRRTGAMGPVGHLITIDAEGAKALWDSGDMETPLGGPEVAGWLASDELLLARQDGPLVQADGTQLGTGPWVDDQPLAVAVRPDGEGAFIAAAQSAWLVDELGTARQVEGWRGQLAAWSWRRDGLALAAVANDSRSIVIDVRTASARALLSGPGGAVLSSLAAPAWLADGRILIAEARQLTVDGRPMVAHLVVQPETGEVRTMNSVLGGAPERTMAVSLVGRVSPNGRYVLYPLAASGEPSRTADMLFDVEAGRAIPIDGLVEPVWAPTSDRIAFLADGRLAVWMVGGADVLALTNDDTVRQHAWSVDGRWLVFCDEAGSLWLVASDGSTAPHKLAPQANWLPPPTWSPVADELAAAVAAQAPAQAEPGPALVLYRFEAVPSTGD